MRGLLAWVFWHSRRPNVSEAEYKSRLLEFHDLLYLNDIDGFLGARILRYDALPWLSSAAEVYEDWYFLRDSAALDRLDQAALDARRLLKHDSVARLASSGTAGLYRLRAGKDPANVDRCRWIAKPEGETYERFFASFRSLDENAFGLWGRQMVLGPTPEFVMTSSGAIEAPLPVVVDLRPRTAAPKRLTEFVR